MGQETPLREPRFHWKLLFWDIELRNWAVLPRRAVVWPAEGAMLDASLKFPRMQNDWSFLSGLPLGTSKVRPL